MLGSGWFILKAPALKSLKLTSDVAGCGGYVLTKLWLLLPDGSEIELRDTATQGAPYLVNNDCGFVDRDRGKVWRSVDGSAITYITDNANGISGGLGGWVLLADGTKFRMGSGNLAGYCTEIIDRNGNRINIAYNTPSAGAVTYTDPLGRQYVLQGGTGGATVTIKGYQGLADRVLTIGTGQVGQMAGGIPINLRADYHSVQRPIYAGDYDQHLQGDEIAVTEHVMPQPHTDLFFHGEGIIEIDGLLVPVQLTFPDGRSFRFRYNIYAELAEIVYPDGGVSQIDYNFEPPGFCEYVPSPFGNQIPGPVRERRVLTDGNNVSVVWKYAIGNQQYPISEIEARQGSSTGPLLFWEKHYFKALNAEYRRCTGFGSQGTGNLKWENAKVEKIERKVGDTAIQTELKTWVQRTPVVWANDPGQSNNAYATAWGHDQPSNDDRVTVEDMLLENNKLKRTEYGYSPDEFNNVTLIKEYNFGTYPSPGNLIRQTVRNYVTSFNGYCYTGLKPFCGSGVWANPGEIIHLRRLLQSEEILDANNSRKAYTEYEYDNYSTDPHHGPLVTNAGMTQYDGSRFAIFATQFSPRGNLTEVSQLQAGSSYLTSYTQYNNAGYPVWARDANGNVSTISYMDNFGLGDDPSNGSTGPNGATFAFATLTTNALGHQTRLQYDYTRGAPTGVRDPNNVISKTTYDVLDRPLTVTAAKGLPEETQTLYSYPTATSNTATVSQKFDATRWLASKTTFDGFGRPILSSRAEDGLPATSASFTIHSQTIYDALGRVKQVSNPYRTNETPVYTTTTYDIAGRVVSVTTPDGAHVDTAFDGNRVLVTDQAGSRRLSETDGLGRLAKVWEIKSADAETVPVTFPNYPAVTHGYLTSYSYDALNNLIQVAQGSQRRWFAYDALSRLLRARNPEQSAISFASPEISVTVGVETNNTWSMAYAYDPNGNLISKKDARQIELTYGYDALNRNTSVNYSNTATNPDHTRSYDNTTPGKYGIGRLWKSYANGSETTGEDVEYTAVTGYDALGRPLSQEQRFKITNSWRPAYTMARAYNLAGAVTEQTYPSGRKVNYAYDNAGRLNQFTGQLGDGNLRTYLDSSSYAPSGQLLRERFGTNNTNPSGTGLYHHLAYNSRLQLTRVVLGKEAANDGAWNLGKLQFFYTAAARSHPGPNTGDSGTDNNGNVTVMQHWTPFSEDDYAGNYKVAQHDRYYYDQLNRLERVEGRQYVFTNGFDVYTQKYNYDRWGNRAIDQAATTTNINKFPCVASITNNRFANCTGYAFQYDLAGNVTYDPTGAGSGTYDAENRLLAASGITSQGTAGGQYAYDANGRRTRFRQNVFAAQPRWRLYIYGFDGELVAEYANEALPAAPSTEYGFRAGERKLIVTGTSGGGAGTSINLPIPNGGFETPEVGAGNYQTSLAGAAWTFTGAAGLSGNGSALNAGNSAAPEGGQAAFLQGGSESSLTQTLSGFDPGRSYQLSLRAAQGMENSKKPPRSAASFEVFFDNLSLGVFSVSTASYATLTTPIFTAPLGKGTLRLVARSREFSDLTVLLDNLTLTGNQPGTNNAEVRWLVADHLGTPRMIIGLSGRLLDDPATTGVDERLVRHDYLPFGEELTSGQGQTPHRLANNGYVGDAVRQKFTGKERDGETGLDYSQFRYYSAIQGRLTRPDEIFIDQSPGDPQSWNMYLYVRNNPLSLIDLTGLYKTLPDGTIVGDKDGECVNGGALCWSEKNQRWQSPKSKNNIAKPIPAYKLSDSEYDHVVNLNRLELGRYRFSGVSEDDEPFEAGVPTKAIIGLVRLATVGRPSKILGAALAAAGKYAQGQQHAHHIVAHSHRLAAISRQILVRFNININSAENGVWLNANGMVFCPGASHASIHTEVYFTEVERLLLSATTRAEAVAVLNYIAEQLAKGTFPYQ
jgi:RHS repeat-associated protein